MTYKCKICNGVMEDRYRCESCNDLWRRLKDNHKWAADRGMRPEREKRVEIYAAIVAAGGRLFETKGA